MNDFLTELSKAIINIQFQLECGLMTDTEALNRTYELTMNSINEQYNKMNGE